MSACLSISNRIEKSHLCNNIVENWAIGPGWVSEPQVLQLDMGSTILVLPMFVNRPAILDIRNQGSEPEDVVACRLSLCDTYTGTS